MNIDPTAIAFGVVGLSAGIGMLFWRKKAELEERCEFLEVMGSDLAQAFDSADDVLGDKNTPKPVREIILALLAAHADRAKGKALALSFMEVQQRDDTLPADGKDPLSQSMTILGRTNSALARKTHHVLASLSFGLVFLNLADSIRVEKIKDEAAKDPVSLWARIARLFDAGNTRHQNGGRGLMHA